MLHRIVVSEHRQDRMTTEDRMHRAAAEMLIHQFQSEPTNGIVHTGDPKDRVNRWTLARRFREFCREQFPELDDFKLWNWYRHYLIQTGYYARRGDGNV